MRVDAHQHFWRLARGDYGWLTPDKTEIYRDFGPADLEPLLARTGMDRTVLVQAAPTEAETDYLLAVAESCPFVAGVVGWVDFEAADAAECVCRAAERKGLVGLRPMIQDQPNPDWMLQPRLAAPLAAMARAGLVLDALVLPVHLDALRQLVDRHPDLRFVLDHGAKPPIAAGELADWAADIRRLAQAPNLACKLSGLVTEAAPRAGVETLRPYVDVLLDAFGPDRLMWGSDWPVVNLRMDYEAWCAICDQLLAPLSPSEREAVFGGVAARLYGLTP